MKASKNTGLLALPLLLVTLWAVAHDRSEHAEKNVKPDCAAMDHDGMDNNDPVMQAMMKKCMSEKSGSDDHHYHDSDHDNGQQDSAASPRAEDSPASDEHSGHGDHQ